MKILRAAAPTSEAAVLRHIQKNGSALSGSELIPQLIDEFEHTGPNGVHRCIISEVLGPPLSSDIEELYPDEVDPIDIAIRITSQVALGLKYLHSCGVVHGDLHVGNILFHSPSIASWSSQEEVYQYLEPPCRYNVHQSKKKGPGPLSPHVPEYIVGTPDPTSLLKLCLSNPTQLNIRICDFSEAFIYIPGIKRKMNTPAVYAAPEILLDDCPSPASDVWAFAVLFHKLLACSYIFPSRSNEVLRHMVVVQSKLPEHLWLKWTDRGQYFDDNAQWLADPEKFPHRLVGTLFNVRSDRMDAAEQEIFRSMLSRMVAYEPKERPTMNEVVDLILDTWSKSLPRLCNDSIYPTTKPTVSVESSG